MKSDFWRYQIILTVLFIFWTGFFDTGGLLNQLVFNFALFYPLGFLIGFRPELESKSTAYISAFLFNCSSYVIAMASGIPIQSWFIVTIDFLSVLVILETGRIVGKCASQK